MSSHAMLNLAKGRKPMDLQKNGAFIAKSRKEKNITQKQLGEQLGVSDKTVSKWERGNSFPDVELLLPLCKELDLTVNELLVGERIEVEEYKQRAEANMVELIHDNHVEKRRTVRKFASACIWLCAVIIFGIVLLTMADMTGMKIMYYVDGPSFIAMVVITILILASTKKCGLFFKSFSLVFDDLAEEERINQSIESVDLTQKIFLLCGIFLSLFGVIAVLSGNYSNVTKLLLNLSVALPSTLYGIAGAILLEILKSRLNDLH